MLDAKTFLVDTNVWIDYFMATEPHGKEVLAFFEAVASSDAKHRLPESLTTPRLPPRRGRVCAR